MKMKEKKNYPTSEAHHRWVGEKISYSGIHVWIFRNFPKPKICSKCGTVKAKRYEWANISGEYFRDKKDWIRLCYPCHRAFDGQYGEGNGRAKLKEEDVSEIRSLYKDNSYSRYQLGAIFGVCHGTICDILKRKIWRHI